MFSTDSSLVSWWRWDGDGSDSGPAGIKGSLQNGIGFGDGPDGKVLQCDGVDDYSDMGSGAVLDLEGPLTVSAWIKGDGMPTSADSGILNMGSLNYALTYHTDGNAYFYIGDGGNNLSVPIGPNTWHRVAGVFDGTMNADGMRFYLDSALAGAKGSSMTKTGAKGPLWVGRYAESYFKGQIDDVMLFSGALSDTALLNDFCAKQALGASGPSSAECMP